jgi:4-hydroxyphenylpyruvate dioxygenase
MALLLISRNYHNDLGAKFDLTADLVQHTVTTAILYDRDGDAEYFQFYSLAALVRFKDEAHF